jgi:formylglycine-generating enzyme
LGKAFTAFGAKAEWFQRECPPHRVRITHPFYLGKYEVTVGQFRQFVAATGYNAEATPRKPVEEAKAGSGKPPTPSGTWREPGFAQTDDYPVVNASWTDAVAFCQWLSHKEGKLYRLPTEAEWEYACRAATTTRYCSGDDPETLVRVGNSADAAYRTVFPNKGAAIAGNDGYAYTAPVGSFQPNAFGLYDMHGNAWEWCADRYSATYYAESPRDDPTGPKTGTMRVYRGGSARTSPVAARSAARSSAGPARREPKGGFRVARNP